MIIILQKSKMDIFCVLHKERKKSNNLQNVNNHDKESKEDTMAKKAEGKNHLVHQNKKGEWEHHPLK